MPLLLQVSPFEIQHQDSINVMVVDVGWRQKIRCTVAHTTLVFALLSSSSSASTFSTPFIFFRPRPPRLDTEGFFVDPQALTEIRMTMLRHRLQVPRNVVPELIAGGPASHPERLFFQELGQTHGHPISPVILSLFLVVTARNVVLSSCHELLVKRINF